MALVTRTLSNVGSPLVSPNGTPLANVKIDFVLTPVVTTGNDVFDALTGERVTGTTSALTNAAGEFTVQLWPNDRGAIATQYLCRVASATVKDFKASVPSGATTLSWVAFMAQGTTLTPAQIATLEQVANKDASGGYAGLTLFNLNMKNVLGTITSFFTNSNTAARTYTLPDVSGTLSAYAQNGSGNVVGLVGPNLELIRDSILRSTPVRIATFGDSIANLGITQSPDSQDTTSVTAPFPVSGATQIGLAQLKWMTPVFYPQAYLVANCGVSGDTTTLMLARDGAAYSTMRKAIQDCLDLNADVVFYRGGSINDISAVTPANWQSVADAAFLRHKTILGRLIDGGVTVFDQGIYGYGDGSGATATYPDTVRTALKYLNGLISAYCATLPGQLYYLDPVIAGLQDTNGRYVVGTTSDGVHLSYYGQMLSAKLEAKTLASAFGQSSGVRYKGSNLISNYMFQNTGAVAQGIAATGITFGTTNSTGANAKIELIGNKQYQTCEFTFNAAANGSTINMTAPIATAGIVANDIWGFEFDFFIVPVSGITNITATSLAGRIDILKTANGRVIDVNDFGNITLPPEGISGKMVMAPFKIQEPSANIVHNSYSLILNTNHTSGTVKMGVANPRMVKLGVAQTTT